MSDLLIVSSPTSRPLCTDVPVPMDVACPGPASPQTFHREWSPDCPECGPFTVARWTEMPCDCGHRDIPGASGHDDWCGRGGAVVGLVEVVGPSHHSDDCADPYRIGAQARDAQGRTRCDPDALPDCWHTPTGTVTPLAEPIPCERSWQCGACGPDCGDAPSCNGEVRPSVWVADGSVHEQLRGATSQ